MQDSRKTLSRCFAAQRRGFTLVELMIVVLIIAVLFTIAGLLFAPLRHKACITIARYDLKKFFEAQQIQLTDNNDFLGTTGDIISNAPGIASTISLPDYSPSKNTYITITNEDPFTAEARQLGVGIVLECDVKTGLIQER